MSLLRPISIFLRNFLIRQHPYLSCCASCGEIATPLGNRLCTSLQFGFPTDAVLDMPQDSADAILNAARRLADSLPWLRKIYILSEGQPATHSPEAKIQAIAPPLADADQPTPRHPLPRVAALHRLPDLSEYYLVFFSARRLKKSLLPHDFYTPNGIPLLPPSVLERSFAGGVSGQGGNPAALLSLALSPGRYARTDDLTVIAHTRDNSAQFFPLFTQFWDTARDTLPPEQAYAAFLQDWLFAAGRGVVTPHTPFAQ
jgi:hypothetical protein